MLYVIAGHGAGDSGAVGNGYEEQERVRALATRIKALGGDAVTLHPFEDNAYTSGAISGLSLPKGAKVLELHLDSFTTPEPRGGHVIIKQGIGGADEWDKALAAFISGMFAGRSQTIVERASLANANRAAKRGINYRLMEVCFITNADDMRKFNDNLDAVAAGILEAMGEGVADEPEAEQKPAEPSEQPKPEPEPSKPAAGAKTAVIDVQVWLNTQYGAGLAVDGLFGAKTKGGLVRGLQTELNKQYNRKLTVDGLFGAKTKNACVNVKQGAKGNITKLLQGALICEGYDTGGLDGVFGAKTYAAVRAFQKSRGLAVDGVAGRNTWGALLKNV